MTPFESKLARRADFGLRKRALGLIFEPENPFNAAQPRKIGRIAGTLGLLALCSAGLFLYFNVRQFQGGSP